MANEPTAPSQRPWLTLGAALASVALIFGWYVQRFAIWDDMFLMENGPIEALEQVALGLALILFMVCVRRAGPIGAWCVPVAVVLFYAVIRETPRCDSRTFEGGVCLYREAKYCLIGTACVIGAVLLLLRRADWPAMLKPASILMFWPLWIAGLILVGAELAEKLAEQGIEEALEMAAYLFAIAFGVWLLRGHDIRRASG